MRAMNDHGSSLKLKSRERRGIYNKYIPEFKAKFARYVIENGNCQAAQKFSTIDKVIDESSVRGWVTTYKREVERKRKAGEEVSTLSFSPCSKM